MWGPAAAAAAAAAARTACDVSPVTGMAVSRNLGLVVGRSSFILHWVHSVTHIMLASERMTRVRDDGLRGVFISRKTRSPASPNEIGIWEMKCIFEDPLYHSWRILGVFPRNGDSYVSRTGVW